MPSPVDRRSVDLSAFPDLVVIYLGMRVRTLGGIKMLLGLGPQIDKAGAGRPEGLLHFENNIIFSLFPFHLGMRWYWKDFASMERWARSPPLGLQAFAPGIPARGPMFSARKRLHVAGETPAQPAGVAEPDLY